MCIAREKTQGIVLSQWACDVSRLSLGVSGAEVTGGSALRLLGVTSDRLLHFGAHCSQLACRSVPVSPTSDA